MSSENAAPLRPQREEWRNLEKDAYGADPAPHPVMREFARVAYARKLSYTKLVLKLNQRDKTRLVTRNVTQHFAVTARRGPHAETVISYQSILGVSDRHLRAVTRRLTERDLRWGSRRLIYELVERAQMDQRIRSHEVAEAVNELEARFRPAPAPGLVDALHDYVLERERLRHRCVSSVESGGAPISEALRAWWSDNPALFAFAKTALERADFNLFRYIQPLGKLAYRDEPGDLGQWLRATNDIFGGDPDLVRLHLKGLLRTLCHGREAFVRGIAAYYDSGEEGDSAASMQARSEERALFGGVSIAWLLNQLESEELGAICAWCGRDGGP